LAGTSTTPVLRWNTAGITVAGIVGSPGTSNNQLNTPYDALVDYAYNMYIADRYNNRIQKYFSGSSTGQTVAGNSTYGSSQSQINGPVQSIIDSSQNLYIADAFNQRIQFWSQGAASGTTLAGIGKNINTALDVFLSIIFDDLCYKLLFSVGVHNQSMSI
jgi:hypothetical protein